MAVYYWYSEVEAANNGCMAEMLPGGQTVIYSSKSEALDPPSPDHIMIGHANTHDRPTILINEDGRKKYITHAGCAYLSHEGIAVSSDNLRDPVLWFDFARAALAAHIAAGFVEKILPTPPPRMNISPS